MTEPSSPPPAWAEAAARAAAELGLGAALPGLSPADWARVCDRAGQILAGQGQGLPPGWERALAGALGRADPEVLGRADPEVLARDAADAVLAEAGEVFATEDDA